jgi:anti-anti-sigma regulatory factor
VDLSNRAQLQAALSAVDLGGAHTVRLDLQHLSFCDTRGCWHILRFERDARLSGYETSIHGAKPTVRKVLALISGADRPTFA